MGSIGIFVCVCMCNNNNKEIINLGGYMRGAGGRSLGKIDVDAVFIYEFLKK